MAKESAGERQLRKALLELPDIVRATQAGNFVYTDFLIHSPLANEGLVEFNEEIKNEAGEVATRATAKGIEKVMSEIETVVEKPLFEIVNIALPTPVRGGGVRKSQYPFASLEVGQSFFVAATEKHPEPAKSLASTVSAAMKRYDIPDLDENGIQKTKLTKNPKTGEVKENVPCMKHTRKFSIAAIADGVAYGKPGIAGAAIGRTA